MSQYKPYLIYAFFLAMLIVLFILPLKPNDNHKNIWLINSIEQQSTDYYNNTLTKLGIAWASVKLASKLTAMIQRGEISFHFGVGVTVAPGELLAAISDNLERISSLLFALIVLALLQKISIGLVTFLVFKCLFPLAFICLFFYNIFFYHLKLNILGLKNIGFFLLKISFLIWLFFPLTATMNTYIYDFYLNEEFETNMHNIHDQQETLEETLNNNFLGHREQNGTTNDEVLQSHSWMQEQWGNVKGFFDNMQKAPKKLGEIKNNIFENINSAMNYLDEMVERFMKVIALFILTEIVIPVGSFFIFLAILKRIFSIITPPIASS